MSRRFVIEADGGSRGNPGPAGFGAVVRDADSGEVLAEVAESIGRATNNVAEYRGLIAGLEAAARLDPGARVEARMDSKLVVEQMSGRWRIKHPDMQPLAREARDLAAGFPAVRYTWVPRARNAHADRLANEAMDAAAKGRSGTVASRAARSAAPAAPAAAEPAGQPERAARPAAAESRTDAAGTGWGAPETAATRLLLLRHGQTPLSAEQRFAGVGDIALTDTGHEQAEAVARRLAEHAGSVDVIASSPLRRAADTAAAVAKELALPVEEVEGLRETDFGEWEGLTFAEARERWPRELNRWLADPAAAPPGGESFAAVGRRVAAARDALLARHQGRTVLVVTHVTPIKVLVQQAMLAPPQALYRMHLDVASLTEVDCYADGPMVVRSLNDTAHLRGR
ncbi:bifunctional RNase H/acid phosphatase [Marinitenerispora sediminis]|uniref:Bifunctional RNase H/acid phosphatase n=1 Tax=Marinitenerispora sediminis TaxID=1931232 RepID=A0A368TBH5_9ACTN|nr:bifunctional RNase H/acid phosphatase [Marinitenerispora sediminis]RCV50429.1 bifunctional RNase H/acid phosphatase [Marinitenerispora sediminis]RCV55317.1 bifunctional RNase H/acid phosphatase [Marinitenerispora sediminis]RCV62499.1 bifunctional RNase H/acid phosphatase [Marinitenerispora sediminis]